MTPGEVLDRFGPYLTEDQLKRIDGSFEGYLGMRDDLVGPTMDYQHEDSYYRLYASRRQVFEGSYSRPDTNDWLVQHVEWRSQKRVGFLTFTNEFGDEETTIVSEDFQVPKEAVKETVTKDFGRKCIYYNWDDEQSQMSYKLEWGWIPEIWTGTRIGHDIFCMIGPKPHQFRSMDNPYDVKLGYHGVIYNAMNATPVSLMDRMKPFQYLYFIVMHKLKRLIAQDQGKVFHFDVTMVDPKLGLDKTLYYLKEMNIDFFNPLQNAEQPGQSQRGKVSHTSDMSNMQNILQYVNLLGALDQQISDVAGITRQREGQVTPTEAVTNAQSNIQMSAVLTEIYFQAHSKLWESILMSLLQSAQVAWREKSVIKQYILDDMSLATLQMSPGELDNADIGVFLADSAKENELFAALKSISDGLLNTNRATFSDLITLYTASSAEELKRDIRSSEEQAQQREQQSQQAQAQAQDEALQKEHAFELEKQARQHEHEVLIAEIKSFDFNKDQDINNDNIPDQLEVAKLQFDAGLKKRKLDLEERRLEADQEKAREELKIKRKVASKPTSK